MDDAFGVRRIQCIRELNTPLHQPVERRPTRPKAAIQSFALQQLHRDEGLVMFAMELRFFNCVDRADIGMVQGRSSTGLQQKTIQSILIAGKLWRKKLQSDAATQIEIFSFVNNSHSAAA
jgi:hypothetical protein